MVHYAPLTKYPLMKHIILTGIFIALSFIAYSQTSFTENSLVSPGGSNMLLANDAGNTNPAGCAGEWVSVEGYHLILYANNKAEWKDNGHIYYMTWQSENGTQDDKIKISLVGNNYCKHKTFYLDETEDDRKIVEDKTSLKMYFSKEVTATLQ